MAEVCKLSGAVKNIKMPIQYGRGNVLNGDKWENIV